MSSLLPLIRDCDLFGHQIKLNINKQDRSYKTVFSGAVSIIISSLILSLIVIKT